MASRRRHHVLAASSERVEMAPEGGDHGPSGVDAYSGGGDAESVIFQQARGHAVRLMLGEQERSERFLTVTGALEGIALLLTIGLMAAALTFSHWLICGAILCVLAVLALEDLRGHIRGA